MADTITETRELKIENLFLDGDTRVITLKNPKATITENEISELETLIMDVGETPLLVGDKANAEFRRINTVVREVKTTLALDIGIG